MRQKGSILVTVLVVTMFLSSILFGLLLLANSNLYRARGRIMLLQAQYSAESGADAAIAMLNSGNSSFAGSASEVTVLNGNQYRSTYTTAVTTGSSDKERIIVATGKVYSPKTAVKPKFTRRIRVSAQRSSLEGMSSLVSRNILETGSAVKYIVGKDAYINGFVNLTKNTNKLMIENLTVAGKNTGVNNCSIGGSGSLVKPASFTNPAQTRTKLTLAYNNCISPPGNSSNGNFEVAVNQSNISTIQSMYIPWGQFMDGSYTAAGSCSDWTAGGTVRAIPSLSGSKKTHYPDNNSNIATNCGINGDLNLGSATYSITDTVHIRASLCAASACTPTFTNPTASLKYIFVEGTVNFNSVKTTSGSGPIVLIAYGADPASKTGVCPYGGAIYVGQQGSDYTLAPSLYLLAMNGICFDKTKFGTGPQQNVNGIPAPAIGGIGGKNIYVSTNSGTPWDLALDPSFPANSIPINLSWRQTTYQRL